ncbi:MAG TPA: AMP-binding protein [Iamia sp.]|nr:AMP-binding protein [Iamia sp.]
MDIATLLRRQAAARPLAPATTCAGTTRTWAETDQRVDRLAAHLRGQLSPGQRVAILAPTCHRYFELHFALARAGLVAVPLNIRLTAPELAHIVADASARSLVVDGRVGEVARELVALLPTLTVVLRHGEGAPGGPHAPEYEAIAAAGPSHPIPSPVTDDGALHVLGYTSGTTGSPKGAMLTHRGATLAAIVYATQLQVGPDDRVLACMPGYVYRGGSGGFAPFAVGAHTVVTEFDARTVLRLLAEHAITQVTLAPAMALRLLSAAPPEASFPALERLWLTGAPARPETIRELATRFGCSVGTLYGMTEATGIAMARFTGAPGERLDTVGHPLPLLDVRLLDPAGEEVAPGEVGEITVRGETVMAGYWGDAARTAEVLRDGWLRTGDMARRTEAGELCIVDRRIDIINSGGINVYTLELERTIARHPDVAECAVVGAPDPEWGEVPVAVVVPTEAGTTLDGDAVVAWVRDHLAAYKKPRRVEVVDALPRNAMGKVDKRALRDGYWVGMERRVNG